MARLLYRIGLTSARHAIQIIVAWVAVLGLAVGGFLLFGGTLSSSFALPTTPTTEVSDKIEAELGAGGGATGNVIFSADEAFTEAQQEEITAVLKEITGIDGVDTIVDPFLTQTQITEQSQVLADSTTALEQGRDQLELAEADLTAGLTEIEASLAAAQAAGPEAVASLEAQREQLQAAQTELTASREELETNSTQLDAGVRLLAAAEQLRSVSEDGTTALGTVVFSENGSNLDQSVKNDVTELLDVSAIDGVTVSYGSDLAEFSTDFLGVGEIIGLIIALAVLVIMFRKLLPALMPIVSSAVGVGVSVAGSLALSGVVEMSAVTPFLGLMLGLAVGIDYALFIMHRHRRQLLDGMDVRESIGLANGTAGNAVVFAGATVIIALLALNTTNVSFLGVMGSVGAVSVLVAVLLATTLVPALLGLLGMRVLGRSARAKISPTPASEKPLREKNTPVAILSAVLGVAGLLVVALPALDIRLGLPDGSWEPSDSAPYQAYHAVGDGFGEGRNGPLVVTATLPVSVEESELPVLQADIADDLLENEAVNAVAAAAVSEDRDFLVFQVIPSAGPSSEETEDLVHDLRADATISVGDSEAGQNVELGVAGSPSANIDISDVLGNALPLYLVVVVGLSLLIMIIVFRSLIVPIIATAGYVLSLLAALGAMTAVYQWGWLGGLFGVTDTTPILSFAPIIIMGVLFGLAMDYQLFLVSGMREAFVHGMPARRAVAAGFQNGKAVVIAAAIIMVAVFGGFVFSHLTVVRPLGFGLAVGVLFDAFVVRMLIIPSLMHLFGAKAWWLPRWLDRVVPNVDVEGSALERNTHR